jgi:hypothetical protein
MRKFQKVNIEKVGGRATSIRSMGKRSAAGSILLTFI